jgi:heme-degrading monooxygenase HmoA
MQTTISKENNLVTLINVFTVDPQDQQVLIDILVEATEKVMKNIPGFISANIHKSLDGTKVVNYAQWESKEAFEAMLLNKEAKPHMARAASIAKFEPHLYQVSYVDHK